MDLVAELEKKLHEGEIHRRKLHNTIQELRGNVRVNVRVRPFLRSDGIDPAQAKSILKCDSENSLIRTVGDKKLTFTFDKIFGQTHTQEHIFQVYFFILHTRPFYISDSLAIAGCFGVHPVCN